MDLNQRKLSVAEALSRTLSGTLALPDFQRPFVWPPSKMLSLFESIGSRFYAGGLLLLDGNGRTSRSLFRPEPLHGAPKLPKNGSLSLVLDGQQRLTSVFYAACAPTAPLKIGTQRATRFYANLEVLRGKIYDNGREAFSDLERVFISFPEGSRKAESAERERTLAPLQQLLQLETTPSVAESLRKWLEEFSAEDRFLLRKLRDSILQFEFPYLEISGAEDEEHVINCFTRINEGGTKLTRFDLAHARLTSSPKNINIREMWKEATSEGYSRSRKNLVWAAKAKWLSDDIFLQAFALCIDVTPKAQEIFGAITKLSKTKIQKAFQSAIRGIDNAVADLRGRYGVIEGRFLPTPAIIPALAAVLEMPPRPKKQQHRKKIDAWYWSSVLTGRYRSAVNTNSISDVRAIRKWQKGDFEPDFMARMDKSDIQFSWKSPRSPSYYAVFTALISSGLKDLLTGERLSDTTREIEDDHIFCRKHFGSFWGINSLPNRVLLTKESNGSSGKGAILPSEFAALMTERARSEASLDRSLSLAQISTDGWNSLVEDDYVSFQQSREASLRSFVYDFLGLHLGRPVDDTDSEKDMDADADEDWEEEYTEAGADA